MLLHKLLLITQNAEIPFTKSVLLDDRNAEWKVNEIFLYIFYPFLNCLKLGI